ncbi:MAG: hypothetical protein N3B14_03250 [Thermoleophilia bacterium]|nr:hypothetical protein [Thermoleophilia bacterium]
MSEVDERIQQSKNWLERIAEKIPLYKGYKQKELRREADKMERTYTASRLDDCLAKLESLKAALLQAGKLDLLDDIDAVMRKVRRVKDRIQFADYGYAGLFDATKVDESVLDQLRAFDAQIDQETAAVVQLIDALAADSPSLASDVQLLGARLEELDSHFDERENVVTRAGR